MNKLAILSCSAALLLVGLSCNLAFQSAPETPTILTSPLTPTATLPPITTDTSGPACNVLQDLNLRAGPGTAYRPPVRVLPANTKLTPLAFNPVGIPGGPWVQVRQEGQPDIGWVSAGDQFVACNIDLGSLPSVNVAPPPPPPAPQTENSTPEGNFPSNLVVDADFNPQYFIRFRVFDQNVGTRDGDGIARVSFVVRDKNENTIYEHSEQTAGYCIFGGGEPQCNPWVLENFVYKWQPGGEPVQNGEYQLEVFVLTDDNEEGNWRYQIKLELPP